MFDGSLFSRFFIFWKSCLNSSISFNSLLILLETCASCNAFILEILFSPILKSFIASTIPTISSVLLLAIFTSSPLDNVTNFSSFLTDSRTVSTSFSSIPSILKFTLKSSFSTDLILISTPILRTFFILSLTLIFTFSEYFSSIISAIAKNSFLSITSTMSSDFNCFALNPTYILYSNSIIWASAYFWKSSEISLWSFLFFLGIK